MLLRAFFPRLFGVVLASGGVSTVSPPVDMQSDSMSPQLATTPAKMNSWQKLRVKPIPTTSSTSGVQLSVVLGRHSQGVVEGRYERSFQSAVGLHGSNSKEP